ncbi:hypothetical protein [Sphingobium sp. EP60837]|uniref:hypothetical protein n=1 Tax=Sphingobium sp. EP60837 TaxID=1855519 RepID=UPI00082CB00F|nr:hypothetical protein [Sphingobium sp. EP60837]
MADDFATVAVAQPSSLNSTTDQRRRVAFETAPRAFADRADRGVEILSRWAGIGTFAAAVAAIGSLIF